MFLQTSMGIYLVRPSLLFLWGYCGYRQLGKFVILWWHRLQVRPKQTSWPWPRLLEACWDRQRQVWGVEREGSRASGLTTAVTSIGVFIETSGGSLGLCLWQYKSDRDMEGWWRLSWKFRHSMRLLHLSSRMGFYTSCMYVMQTLKT